MEGYEDGMRFDRYMERCLYEPGGFYAGSGTAGRAKGDFITSPEVGPLFGAVLANVLDAWWDDAGRPDPFTVYDVGCGPNKLLRSVELARRGADRPWRLVGVDIASNAAELSKLPEELTGSVVVANELLDNLPFRIVERSGDDRWAEVYVDDGPDAPTEVLRPTDVRLDIPPGTRVPLLERAGTWCGDVLARNPAHLLVIDYGAATTAELAERGGWLRTYRHHQRGHDPYAEPGRFDITTDIAFDQFPTSPRPIIETQADFLRRWGIEDLVDEGRRYWTDHADAPDLTAMMMRSRIAEAEALLDPTGLGTWLVGHWSLHHHGRD